MSLPGGWDLVIIALVILVLFGATRLPNAARSLGRSMRIFKSEMDEMKTDKAPEKAAAEQHALTNEQQIIDQQPVQNFGQQPAPQAQPVQQPAQQYAQPTQPVQQQYTQPAQPTQPVQQQPVQPAQPQANAVPVQNPNDGVTGGPIHPETNGQAPQQPGQQN